MMEHWNISTAFIHALSRRRCGCARQAGTKSKAKRNWVYLLKKAPYETKQAAHAWQQHLKKFHGGYWFPVTDP